MKAKHLTSAIAAVAAIALSGTVAFASPTTNSDNDNSEHKWMPKQPVSTYWQAPDFNFSEPERAARPAYTPAQHMPPMRNNPNRPPVASRPTNPDMSRSGMNRPDMSRPGMNRPNMSRPAMNQPGMSRPGMNRHNMNQQNMNCPNMNCPNMNQRGMNQRNMGRPDMNMMPPMQRSNRGYPPPRGPYYGPDRGASAYNMPGYNPNRQYRMGGHPGNRRNNNKFWGRSGPSTWMNPSKRNWENSWDDMINSPSRMGTMPGGWTAPEVTMPNPIDMGDQMQDNLKDLPEQMKDMDVGNDVTD